MVVVYLLNSTKATPPSFPYSMSSTDVTFLKEGWFAEKIVPTPWYIFGDILTGKYIDFEC